MSEPSGSLYRDALQVAPTRLTSMTEDDLTLLMTQLLHSQAYVCHSPQGQIRVNTEEKAKDDGCDGWTGKPAIPDDWLGSTDTCWQFKAGSAGERGRLSGEVTKRIPSRTLAAGGRFVVVASRVTNGKRGETNRLEKLISEAKKANLPTDKIEVIGTDRLAFWCNQHPAVAAYWAGRPEGLWTLKDWCQADEHRAPWQASETMVEEIACQRRNLEFGDDKVLHLHIYGPPGVGKTRFALELCRDADWKGEVIYVRDASDFRLPLLIDSVVADKGARLIVAADEVQYEQLRPLRDSVGRGGGRIRIITVGHSKSPDSVRIPAILVKPLDREKMTAVLRGLHPAMPREHVEFVGHFADGYVRLAQLVARAVIVNPEMNVRGLLNRDEIRAFLDELLGAGDRRPLHVVAALTSVGWEGDIQGEGEAIAKLLGLDWNWVRASVADFDRRLHIIPRGGRYRYMTPTPLGIYLAAEAWDFYPDPMRRLPSVLPSEQAREAYYQRLSSMVSNPQTREFARQELSGFFRLDDFQDVRAVKRWSALAAADPEMASKNILSALTAVDHPSREAISGPARREMVWALVRLAWKPSSFDAAVLALGFLAEAENETWANNATAEFLSRFQILMGGTAVPYLDRLHVLDELLKEGRSSLVKLTIKALAQVGSRRAYRMYTKPVADELPEAEWSPKDRNEHFDCVNAALSKLTEISHMQIADTCTDLVEAAKELTPLLPYPESRGLLRTYYFSVVEANPETRESIRRAIADVLHREKVYSHCLSAEALSEIEELHARFEDSSLESRLQRYVGQIFWERAEEPDLRTLAQELLSSPASLAGAWSWLTSGDAGNSWAFGGALSEVDSQGTIAASWSSFPNRGSDNRVLCGYVFHRRSAFGDHWYEDWLIPQLQRDPGNGALFEVVWRCGVTDKVATVLAESINQQPIPPEMVGQLGYGVWGKDLSADALEQILQALARNAIRHTAIGLLDNRLRSHQEEFSRWKTLAIELILAPDLIRSDQMAHYHWSQVARRLVPEYSRQISAAILREQADRKEEPWFADFSEAANVLALCAQEDPKGFWEELQPFLSSPADAHRFTIGFPLLVLEHLPVDDVMHWIAEQPDVRALTAARMTSFNMQTDTTLASRLLGEYADNDQVAAILFSEFTSGGWTGPTSLHWNELAAVLDTVSKGTALPKLRRWAAHYAEELREMARRTRDWEDEEDLRRG